MPNILDYTPQVVTIIAFESIEKRKNANTLGQALETGYSVGTFYDGLQSTLDDMLHSFHRRHKGQVKFKNKFIGYYLGVSDSSKAVYQDVLRTKLGFGKPRAEFKQRYSAGRI